VDQRDRDHPRVTGGDRRGLRQAAYLNELSSLGCRLREFAEPGLDGYVHLPNFLIAAAER
jgi:hypothetical protein